VEGIAAAFIAYFAAGLGAGAAGTSVLALLAKEAGPARAPAAGPLVWIMMIFGFAISAGLSSFFLDPFSPARLVAVGIGVCASSFLVAIAALWGIESRHSGDESTKAGSGEPRTPFLKALRKVWAAPRSRRLCIFIFVSMLAFSGQELLLEPFAGTVFRLTPGQSAQLSGLLHAGAGAGMISGLLAIALSGRFASRVAGPLIAAGCLGSALGLLSLVCGGIAGQGWPIRASVAALGFANGVFSVTAISAMMSLASKTERSATGTHVGVWGAAQALASGLGGLLGTAAADAARLATGSAHAAYLSVFVAEAALFLLAAWLGYDIARESERDVEADPGRGIAIPHQTATMSC
jgi:MFS transporter, BCD family, chlorophyll transporter